MRLVDEYGDDLAGLPDYDNGVVVKTHLVTLDDNGEPEFENVEMYIQYPDCVKEQLEAKKEAERRNKLVDQIPDIAEAICCLYEMMEVNNDPEASN